MILHDFECQACENRFEGLEAKDTIIVCPACGSEDTIKLFSAVRVGLYNNAEVRAEVLKKRSRDHTASEQRKGNMLSPRDVSQMKSAKDLRNAK